MPVSINNSFNALGNRNIGISTNRLGENLAKLSSGRKINKASDNAAALAIAEQLSADIRSAEQAQRNLSDGAAVTRVAEGGLSQISDLLARGRELSIQAANGTLSDEQRATLNREITAIKEEIDRTANVTEFNGQKLLNGELAPGAPTELSVQAGIQNTPSDRISLNVIEDSGAAALGIDGVDISTQQGARDALSAFDSAIQKVSQNRANIGSLQNRFDTAASNLAVSRENLTAAESTIRDLDYAKEASSFQRNQVLTQAAVSVLRQGQQSQAGIVGSLLNIRA